MSQKTWTVKNQASGETLENLPQREFVRWVSGLSANEIGQWNVCSTENGQWSPLGAITAFRLRRFGLPVIPSELAFTAAQLAWLESNLPRPGIEVSAPRQAMISPAPVPVPAAAHVPAPTPAPAPQSNRRAHERFNVKLQVVILSEENAFRTFTRNISMGGLALEKAIPKNLTGSQCSIFISDPTSHRKISFSGVVIAETGSAEGSKHRIRFESLDAKSAEDLANYIQIALAEHEEAA